MIGSALDFLEPDTFRDGIPFTAHRPLRDTEPVSFRAHAGERGYWFMTRHDDISAVLVDAKAYSSWRGTTSMMDPPAERLDFARRILVNMDPPAHTRYRRLITQSVASRAVERLTPRLDGALQKDHRRHRGPWLVRLRGRRRQQAADAGDL